MIISVDHFVITTSDPDACKDFYHRLGFELRDNGDWFELFSGNFKLNVPIKGSEKTPQAANAQEGSLDICFEISTHIEKFQALVVSKGMRIEYGPVQRIGAKGPMESIYLRDPDGNLLEFCHYHKL